MPSPSSVVSAHDIARAQIRTVLSVTHSTFAISFCRSPFACIIFASMIFCSLFIMGSPLLMVFYHILSSRLTPFYYTKSGNFISVFSVNFKSVMTEIKIILTMVTFFNDNGVIFIITYDTLV